MGLLSGRGSRQPIMSPQNHPRDGLLGEFAIGTLEAWELDRVAEHLAICERCRIRVDDLLARDGFLGRLRSASAPTDGMFESADERREAALALQQEAVRARLGTSAPARDEYAEPRTIADYQILRE